MTKLSGPYFLTEDLTEERKFLKIVLRGVIDKIIQIFLFKDVKKNCLQIIFTFLAIFAVCLGYVYCSFKIIVIHNCYIIVKGLSKIKNLGGDII